MIYLYTYYTIVFLYAVVLAYTAYKVDGLAKRLFFGATSVFVVTTATMLGLIHSWTGEGFSYFGSILQQVVAVISNGKGI